MIREHINTFLILAARAQKGGLIELNELAAVAQAVEAAQKELNPQPEQSAPSEAKAKKNEQDVQNKAG